MGPSLQELLLSQNPHKFSVKSVCLIGLQILDNLENLHTKTGFVHGEITPSTFFIGKGDNYNLIFLGDIGLGKEFWDKKNNFHKFLSKSKNMKFNKRLIEANPFFCSINVMKGFEQSRRDDLESFSYLLMYFLKGTLPWMDNNFENDILNKEKNIKRILEMKTKFDEFDYCKEFNKEFGKFIKYTRNLNFDDNPDYNYLRNLLNNILIEVGSKKDNEFDWCLEKEQEENENKVIDIKKKSEYKFDFESNLVTKESYRKGFKKKSFNGENFKIGYFYIG